MTDNDVLIIERYIYENFRELNLDESYSKWAANEILDRVIFEASKLPSHITGIEGVSIEELVESFIGEMDYYSYISVEDSARETFSTAREEGKMVLCYIHSMKGENRWAK